MGFGNIFEKFGAKKREFNKWDKWVKSITVEESNLETEFNAEPAGGILELLKAATEAAREKVEAEPQGA